MREIKFRCWNEVDEKMYKVLQITFELIKDSEGFVYYEKILSTGERRAIAQKLSDVILMQYIGLLDKQGKEIYEGDIVRYNGLYFEHGLYEIKFVNGSFIGINEKDELNFRKDFDFENVEVVGNIYENPELLSLISYK
jgi:uncharacterized phage protein (TIGR01671 family)